MLGARALGACDLEGDAFEAGDAEDSAALGDGPSVRVSSASTSRECGDCVPNGGGAGLRGGLRSR